jgi:hypothetical protein
MRSDKIRGIVSQGINRYEVCQLVDKGVKVFHRNGTRFEDSINDVLQYLSTHKKPEKGIHPALPPDNRKALKPAA